MTGPTASGRSSATASAHVDELTAELAERTADLEQATTGADRLGDELRGGRPRTPRS